MYMYYINLHCTVATATCIFMFFPLPSPPHPPHTYLSLFRGCSVLSMPSMRLSKHATMALWRSGGCKAITLSRSDLKYCRGRQGWYSLNRELRWSQLHSCSTVETRLTHYQKHMSDLFMIEAYTHIHTCHQECMSHRRRWEGASHSIVPCCVE